MSKVTFDQVRAVAAKMGAKSEAMKKWRQRARIPHQWQIAVVRETGGTIGFNDMAPDRLFAREGEAA